MIRATLDANVIVSGTRGLPRDDSVPGAILRRLRSGDFELVTSEHITTEALNAMKKPYFRQRLTHAEIEVFRLFLANEDSHVFLSTIVHGIATHPEDDLVLATALSGNADYLVTGDKGLLGVGRYQGVTIVSPRDFLNILDNDY